MRTLNAVAVEALCLLIAQLLLGKQLDRVAAVGLTGPRVDKTHVIACRIAQSAVRISCIHIGGVCVCNVAQVNIFLLVARVGAQVVVAIYKRVLVLVVGKLIAVLTVSCIVHVDGALVVVVVAVVYVYQGCVLTIYKLAAQLIRISGGTVRVGQRGAIVAIAVRGVVIYMIRVRDIRLGVGRFDSIAASAWYWRIHKFLNNKI